MAGFVAVWRGDRLRVFGSSVSDAPVGATILDCDGRDIRAIMLENVFAYGGRADEPGQWWASATNLFRDDGNPFVKLPQRCRFSAGGTVSELALSWRPVDDQYRAWWRASPDNTRYVSSLPDRLRGEGQAQRAISEVERPASGMKAALAKGEPYWEDPVAPAAQASTAPPAEVAPLKTPVYVIVPGQCASACLDALDLFVHFPNTKLIGAPSSADSVYIDVRIESLPGGLAKVVIPNKLYRNRPRATGQVYTPPIEVDNLQWSTAAFRDVIETDLRAGAPLPRDPS
jgi:hypothetical protein